MIIKISRCLALFALVASTCLFSPAPAASQASTKLYLPVISRPITPSWIGPDGGSVVAVAGDASNPNVIYAGTFGAGVFKTVDGGERWSFASQGISVQMIDSLAVDPTNGSIVYAGSHGGGVYKTVDGGQSWVPVNQGIQQEAVVYTLAVNPGNPQIVYAGTRGIVAAPGPPWNGILYRTTDGGASWQPVLDTIGGPEQEDWIYSVRANPARPNMVLAAAHEHGIFLADAYGGEGDWQPVGNVDGSGRAVDFDPRDWKSTAYYGTWHRTGIYRSADGGFSWEQSSGGLGEAKIYPNGIAIAAADPNVVYLASFADPVHGVMRSGDGGLGWTRAGLEESYVYSVYVPPGQSGTVFAGTAFQNGLYKTIDGGMSWNKRVAGLTHVNASGLVFVPPSTLYASTRDTGIMRSTDNGATWVEWNAGLADRQVIGLVQSPQDPTRIFAMTVSAGLRRLDTSSGTWIAAGSFPAGPARPGTVEGISFVTPDRILIDEMLGQDSPFLQGGLTAPVIAMTFAPSNPKIAYAVTPNAGLFISQDGGLSWNYAAWNGRSLQAVVVHPTNPNQLFLAADNGTHLLGSFDGGKSWPFDVPLPQGAIQVLAVSPGELGAVYAAATTGLWRVENSVWARAGLDGQNVLSLAVNPARPWLLYAGTASGVSQCVFGSCADISAEAAGYTISNIFFRHGEGLTMYLATTTRGFLRAPIP